MLPLEWAELDNTFSYPFAHQKPESTTFLASQNHPPVNPKAVGCNDGLWPQESSRCPMHKAQPGGEGFGQVLSKQKLRLHFTFTTFLTKESAPIKEKKISIKMNFSLPPDKSVLSNRAKLTQK